MAKYLSLGSAGLLVGWLAALLVAVAVVVGWVVGPLVGWLVGPVVGRLAGRDVGLVVGRVVGFVVGEVVGAVVGCGAGAVVAPSDAQDAVKGSELGEKPNAAETSRARMGSTYRMGLPISLLEVHDHLAADHHALDLRVGVERITVQKDQVRLLVGLDRAVVLLHG